jgi:hypothetical protein
MLISVPVVLLSGVVLCIVLPGRKKPAGFLYSLLIPALMIGVCARAQSVDLRKLTEARAELVTQGIEKYFVQEGHYPQNLQQMSANRPLTTIVRNIRTGIGHCKPMENQRQPPISANEAGW